MNRPDYSGGGVANLMASLIAARGGHADSAELGALPAAELAGARHVVMLVIDGLGDRWLRRTAPGSLLARHRIAAITTVFPPTTASAITTYLTGDAPQQHGLTGWFMWLRELGCLMTVLPGTPRFGGVGYGATGVDLDQLFGHRSVFARIASRGVAVSPRKIARSDYNLAHLGPAELRPFKGLRGLRRQIARAVRKASAPSYVYGYWPGLDSIGHARGIESAKAAAHLAAIDAELEALAGALRGTDTALIVSADHGQIDTTPDDVTELADHPELADCLRIPLCGEPRAAFCYLRPDRVKTFEDYCGDVLADRFTLHPSSELLAQGLFGLGAPHPRLGERIGDYTLLARGRNVIRDRLLPETQFRQIGVHGGLSKAELFVPLCLIRC